VESREVIGVQREIKRILYVFELGIHNNFDFLGGYLVSFGAIQEHIEVNFH